jgi:hypothetical protein
MEMNEHQAFEIIDSMIHSAKKEIKDNGFYYSFWGWLVFIAALSDYVLLVFLNNEYHALPWAILMPIGGLVTAIVSFRERKKVKQAKTYLDEMMKYAVTAFAVSLFIVCFIMPMTDANWRSFYPTIMVIYAIWLYISGGALKFKPLIIGGLINWLMAALAFFASYDNQLLLMAFAVLTGYIIPGYLLNKEFKKHVQGS